MTGLQALKRLKQETCPATYMPDFDKNECCNVVESELKALEFLTKCGIALVVPESECLNNERLTIQLYKKHTTKEQWKKLLELFDIK